MMLNPLQALDLLRAAFFGPGPERHFGSVNEEMFTQQMSAFVKPDPPMGLGFTPAEWRDIAAGWKAEAERSEATIEAAIRAVESLRNRKDEDVNVWAKELGAIFGAYTD
jgi:hypothetical protein